MLFSIFRYMLQRGIIAYWLPIVCLSESVRLQQGLGRVEVGPPLADLGIGGCEPPQEMMGLVPSAQGR